MLAAKREYCRRSLSNFIRLAWPVIEPGQTYVHGWHIDAMAEHLEAVARSEITRLYIAVPPGSMKSLMVSVFFPAWRWIDQPSTRVIAASHAERLAIRDNMRCRRLVQSDWYQSLFGDRVQLVADQNAKTKFENTATGFREAMPFTSLTGSRGDFVGIDDPLSVDDAASPAKREAVTQTFLEAVPTRLNNPNRSAIVAIQQRLHERDVIGVIEAKELGYDALVIPMEYEPEAARVTSIGWRDPRTKAGELMFPERFPRDVLDGLRASLGGFAWAAQMQQRPVPREGGMFARHWFEVVDAPPAGARRVRRWDLAATAASGANDPDWTVG
ncbi:MAG: terminase, partial [Pseudomonadota bacterium]|nr:terminase [Pseudomonadota bacterium]